MTDHRPEHNREERGGPAAHGGAEVLDGYDAATAAAAVLRRGMRGLISIAGADAVSFLHGILTNDIRSLRPGQACYAAYLTPQGRMIADMDVLRRTDDLLLDVEPEVRERLVRRFDESLFAEDVRIADCSGTLASLAVYGPTASDVLSAVLRSDSKHVTIELPGPNRHVGVAPAGSGLDEVLVLGVNDGPCHGFHLFADPGAVDEIAVRLLDAGAAMLEPLAAESLRIEAGIPRFGVDMTEETIPLEAGIEARAISMTKGCYVGQEVIVRILHRGQGRVARRLVGLRVDGGAVPEAGAPLMAGGREVGRVTSAIDSPRLGPIALGYVHRDHTEPGTRLQLTADGGATATVSHLPFKTS